ncbi:glycoside hydrolase family 16 protein [Marasmius fiardii PR-910]|nr:glycoside hydrolase family 16 protein [Marasmius fiardii PR-910]
MSSVYGSRPSSSSAYGSRPSTGNRQREAFASPPSRPLTIYSAPSAAKTTRERPKSTMLASKPTLSKPWIGKHDPYARIAYTLTYAVAFLGIAASAIKCYFDYQSLPFLTENLCPVLDENFDSSDGVFGDNGKFFREVDMSGFGNGEFAMATGSENNSFVANGNLYILPTLTSDSIPLDTILDGHVYNITDCTFNITRGATYTQSSSVDDPHSLGTSPIGVDTFDAEGYYKACSAYSNATEGKIINPVQSARLSTRKSASIKYGKVEVRAKIPTGDWMWPAIWMLPVDNTYGAWPLSGEIDIMEARGNGQSYPRQGTNYVRGSLNWGPTLWLNAVAKTYGWWKMRRGSYDSDFHTYTLEWTPKFMQVFFFFFPLPTFRRRIYVDTRLHHLFETKLNEDFWDRGEFPAVIQNGSEVINLSNPWVNGTKAAPFDQRFYLILNVAVGGTNGWFPDGNEKPWLNGATTAMRDFLLAKDQWYPSWPENLEKRAFVIDYVKMWQLC